MKLIKSQELFPSLPSLINRFFEGDLMDWGNDNFSSQNSTLPAVNVLENEDEFQIEVAAPGMKRDDFKVKYDNGRLIISSERREERKDKNQNYTRQEFSYQSFQRAFAVPESIVEGEKIEAKYNDGILHIILPKKEELKPKPAKEIAIS